MLMRSLVVDMVSCCDGSLMRVEGNNTSSQIATKLGITSDDEGELTASSSERLF